MFKKSFFSLNAQIVVLEMMTLKVKGKNKKGKKGRRKGEMQEERKGEGRGKKGRGNGEEEREGREGEWGGREGEWGGKEGGERDGGKRKREGIWEERMNRCFDVK